MAGGERITNQTTGIQNSAGAIARGSLVCHGGTGAASNPQLVIISTANLTLPAGIAIEASPGQDKPFLLAQTGDVVKAKVGSAGATQGAFVESDASGLAVDSTAGAAHNTFGRFLETGVSGDFVLVAVHCQKITTVAP